MQIAVDADWPVESGVVALALDPVAVVILVILLLDGGPGDPVGALLVLVVLLPGAVERFLLDALSVRREIVLDRIRQVSPVPVRHHSLLSLPVSDVSTNSVAERMPT